MQNCRISLNALLLHQLAPQRDMHNIPVIFADTAISISKQLRLGTQMKMEIKYATFAVIICLLFAITFAIVIIG